MSCLLKEGNGYTYAILGFKREELLYDIKNCSYIEGSIMETDNDHARHMVQDVGEEGNVDRVTRILDLAVAQCKELLYPYTKHEVHRHELDDKFKEQSVYGIVLNVPNGFSQTTLNYLKELIHEYLVCRAVAEWMRITNHGKYETWVGKADDAKSELRGCLQSRLKRTRIRTHPF